VTSDGLAPPSRFAAPLRQAAVFGMIAPAPCLACPAGCAGDPAGPSRSRFTRRFRWPASKPPRRTTTEAGPLATFG